MPSDVLISYQKKKKKKPQRGQHSFPPIPKSTRTHGMHVVEELAFSAFLLHRGRVCRASNYWHLLEPYLPNCSPTSSLRYPLSSLYHNHLPSLSPSWITANSIKQSPPILKCKQIKITKENKIPLLCPCFLQHSLHFSQVPFPADRSSRPHWLPPPPHCPHTRHLLPMSPSCLDHWVLSCCQI